ncbi:hypothetical protein [Phaeobacter sp. B1627]|uniref:hypothetical protein n=1 Tax=Phaeobacter sp. B1627 TaxID=2583809 RepID=UPI0011189F7F|nr:hypothetical protein [Phaeobacter sp. B1627]TNJ41267.1 hypothetical protein FGE21_14430 [Phaeobacter sp. B1627]
MNHHEELVDRKLDRIRTELSSAERRLVPIIAFRAIYRVIEYFADPYPVNGDDHHDRSLAALRGYVAVNQFLRHPNKYWANRCELAQEYLHQHTADFGIGNSHTVANACADLCELCANQLEKTDIELAVRVIRQSASLYLSANLKGVDDHDAVRGLLGLYDGDFLDTIIERDLSPDGKQMLNAFDRPNRTNAIRSYERDEKIPKRKEVSNTILEPLFDLIFNNYLGTDKIDEASVFEKLTDIDASGWEQGPSHLVKMAFKDELGELLLARVHELEDALKAIEAEAPKSDGPQNMIGHNNPPIHMTFEPEVMLQTQAIQVALNSVVEEIAKPSPEIDKLENARETIEGIRQSWGQYFAEKADRTVDEFFKEFGKWSGRLSTAGLSVGALWLLEATGKLEPHLRALRHYISIISG